MTQLHISCLTRLADLDLCSTGQEYTRLAPDIGPGFVLPSSLRKLHLGRDVAVHGAVLATLVQLTELELRYAALTVGVGYAGPALQLLTALASLTQLDRLSLEELRAVRPLGVYDSWPSWPQPPAAYLALTASSKLRHLSTYGSHIPLGAWVHAFPPGRVLTGVTAFSSFYDHAHPDEGEPNFGSRLKAGDVSCWGAEAVAALVRCFPGLQSLWACT